MEWETILKGSGVAIPMRASHIAGQLIAAAFIILTKSYSGMGGELGKAVAGAPPVPTDNGGNSSKKRHGKR